MTGSWHVVNSLRIVAGASAVCFALFIAWCSPAVASANGITLYVETVPNNSTLKTSIQKYLQERSERDHPGSNLIRFTDLQGASALVLRVEKLSSRMAENARRSTVFTLDGNKVDPDQRDAFPRGATVEFDMVVSELTISYAYKLQILVDGEVWDAATLETPEQVLDYRYGEHLRVVGVDGQITHPPEDVYPNQEVAQFLRQAEGSYVDTMYADGMGKAAVHLVAGYFGPINAALRDVHFEDAGTRDGILFAERFKKIAHLLGRVKPAAEECKLRTKVAEMEKNLMKGAHTLSGGRMPFGMGIPVDFPSQLEKIVRAETRRTRSTHAFGNGCTRDIENYGVPMLRELGDEVAALNESLRSLGGVD